MSRNGDTVKISFLVNHIDGGWEATDTRLGGTEESVVEWSKELTKRGHKVTIYNNDTRNDYVGGGDICINVKSSDIEPREPTLYLTNETDASTKDLGVYEGVIWPSQWAVDNIPVNNKTFILPHGYDPSRVYTGEKISKQCLYASSPDRGLDILLRAWPYVYEKHPDAKLIVTYGAPEYDIPGVEFLGEVSEEEMDKLYRESEFWVHPATGGELYCITGIKAQASGCVPVVVPIMALSETVRHGYFVDPRNFGESLAEILDDKETNDKICEELAKEHYPTWEDSTDQLLEIIEKVLK